MQTHIDHLVITAPDLESGQQAVEAALGVELAPGGTHPGMGTHNSLLKLGESIYLEVIAPDPEATRPPQPRWFNLDRLPAHAAPRLAAWVARTDDIHAASAHCADIVGMIAPMTRGSLAWQITIRRDGALPLGGAAPALIEWQTQSHPARSLPDSGCTLADFEVFHPDPEQVHGVYAAIELESRPRVQWALYEPPYLVAYINTPTGQRVLGGVSGALSESP